MTPERQLLQRLVEAVDAWRRSNEVSADSYLAQASLDIATRATALLAQPERPQWTDTPPTQPGWYWWRESAYSPVCAMFGDADHDGDGTIQHWWKGENRMIYGAPLGQWCGPIAPPEE